MDWETLYCPNRRCPCSGQPFHAGRMVKNGTTPGQPQARCRACGWSVVVTEGTAYFGLESEPAVFELAVRALAEGNAWRGTGRIVQVDQATACAWLDRAARHCRQVMLHLWQRLPVTECQLDELWSFVHTKERNLATAQQLCASSGAAWVWVAFVPLWRLVLAFVVGKRDQANANLLVERVAAVTDEQVPFFTSDQLPEYRTALLHVYGVWQQPVRRGSRGRFPHRRRVPHPDLLSAQVVKHRTGGRVVAVTHQVIFGADAAIQARLAQSPTSTMSNTSFVERDNLSLRQHNRRLTRKTNGFSKDSGWLEQQLWLALAYYHLVLPHDSLAAKLAVPEPTRGAGSARRWCPITPAMAAGMTDHAWTTAELLSYRVPATGHDRLHAIEPLFPPLEPVHQGK